MKYNLQFFAEGEEDGDNGEVDVSGTPDNSGASESEVDVSALADLISGKDKEIQQLQQDMAELKKTNAKLLVMVNSGAGQTKQKTFEENLLDMVGYKPRKE